MTTSSLLVEPTRLVPHLLGKKKDGGLRHCFDCMALTGTTFQELTNYWMASKAPRSLVKWTFNKVFFRFWFFPNMWMEHHFRLNLDPINSRLCFLAYAMYRQLSKELWTWFLTAVARLSPFNWMTWLFIPKLRRSICFICARSSPFWEPNASMRSRRSVSFLLPNWNLSALP